MHELLSTLCLLNLDLDWIFTQKYILARPNFQKQKIFRAIYNKIRFSKIGQILFRVQRPISLSSVVSACRIKTYFDFWSYLWLRSYGWSIYLCVDCPTPAYSAKLISVKPNFRKFRPPFSSIRIDIRHLQVSKIPEVALAFILQRNWKEFLRTLYINNTYRQDCQWCFFYK